MICDQTASGARRPGMAERREDENPRGARPARPGSVYDSRTSEGGLVQASTMQFAEPLHELAGRN